MPRPLRLVRRGRTGRRTTGDPVADRWHLIHNLGQAVERCVTAHRRCLCGSAPPAAATPEATNVAPDRSPAGRLADRTRDRHAAVHELLAAGRSLKAITAELGLARGTVRRFARAATPDDLLGDQWQNLPNKLDAHRDYLHQRLSDGVANARVLHAELVERGYTGAVSSVRNYIAPLRRLPATPETPPPNVRTVIGWLTCHPPA
jgi:hypothetical protein